MFFLNRRKLLKNTLFFFVTGIVSKASAKNSFWAVNGYLNSKVSKLDGSSVSGIKCPLPQKPPSSQANCGANSIVECCDRCCGSVRCRNRSGGHVTMCKIRMD